MQKSWIAILSVGIAAALIGMLSVSSFIASSTAEDKNNVESSASEQGASQMALVSDGGSSTSSKVPTSADDFYPVIRERWSGPNTTVITSELEASSLADFDVKFPTVMPDGYTLQLAFVNSDTGEDNKYVFLYYSENPITDNTRVNHFWEQGEFQSSITRM